MNHAHHGKEGYKNHSLLSPKEYTQLCTLKENERTPSLAKRAAVVLSSDV